MTDQLLQDLHALLGEVDVGWHSHGKRAATEVGIGGCLIEEMGRVMGASQYMPEGTKRKAEMMRAMGFTAPLSQSKYGANPKAMYEWNDAQTDPDAIKRRIKDAIEGLGS